MLARALLLMLTAAPDAGTQPPALSLPFTLKHGWGAELDALPPGSMVNDPALVALLKVDLSARHRVVVEGAFVFEGTRTLLVRIEDPMVTTFLTRALVRLDPKGAPVSSTQCGTWGLWERSALAIDAQGTVRVFTEHRGYAEGWTRARGEFTATGTLAPQLSLVWLPHERACFRDQRTFEDLCLEHDGPRTLVWYLQKFDSWRHDVQNLAIVGEPTKNRVDIHFAKDTRVWTLELSDDGKSLRVSSKGMGTQVYTARTLDFDEARWVH